MAGDWELHEAGYRASEARFVCVRLLPGQELVRALRRVAAETGLRRSIPKVPKSTDRASISEKGADAWGNPARQCPIKEKRHGKRG